MTALPLHVEEFDCSLPEQNTPPLHLSAVTAAGTRTSVKARTARVQASPIQGREGDAPTTATFQPQASLDGRRWVDVGDPLTGTGIGGLIDVRGYAALRVRLGTAQAGKACALTLYATDADPDPAP